MKKCLSILIMSMLGCMLLVTEHAAVEGSAEGVSDLSISFEEAPGQPLPDPDPNPKPDPKPDPTPDPKPDPKKLPQLGEMVTSLIVLLSGISLLIIVIGMYVIKKIYSLDYEEKVV